MNIIEEMATAMAEQDSWPRGSTLFAIHWREFGPGYIDGATAALKALRERGFITAEGLIAIKQAEAEGNADAGEAA